MPAFIVPQHLENEQVILHLLREEDFEALYAVAADPLVWEQHPNRDRWQREVFRSFFNEALASGSAYRIVDKVTGEVIGSTRYYGYEPQPGSVMIGYTFYARNCWGRGINTGVKRLMLDYAFQYVPVVYFEVGATNVRSQVAVGRLGALKTAEKEIAHAGEPLKLNFVYTLTREQWNAVTKA